MPRSFITRGDIIEALGVKAHRVDRILRTRADEIRPIAVVSRFRLYPPKAVEQVRRALMHRGRRSERGRQRKERTRNAT